MPNRRWGKQNCNSWHGQERMRKLSHSAFRLSLHSPRWRCVSQWVGLNRYRSVVSDSLRPHGCPWNSPGQNTGVGNLSLLQGIFPTQGSNPGIEPRSPALQADSSPAEVPGKPRADESLYMGCPAQVRWYPFSHPTLWGLTPATATCSGTMRTDGRGCNG